MCPAGFSASIYPPFETRFADVIPIFNPYTAKRDSGRLNFYFVFISRLNHSYWERNVCLNIYVCLF